MRPVHLGLALLVAGAAFSASARGWQGLTPGVTSEADVIARFGQPSTQGRVGGRLALVYKDERAITGTRQAQFYLRDDGTLGEIVVFPTNQFDRETVEGTYGAPTRKAFTDDFRTVWIFRQSGITVYFGKDGFVDAISFKDPTAAAGAGAERRAGGAAPRSPPAGAPVGAPGHPSARSDRAHAGAPVAAPWTDAPRGVESTSARRWVDSEPGREHPSPTAVREGDAGRAARR